MPCISRAHAAARFPWQHARLSPRDGLRLASQPAPQTHLRYPVALRLLPLILGLSAVPSPAFRHPGVFLDSSGIEAVKRRVAEGAAPWKGAYDDLLSEAAAAMGRAPYSVTYQGSSGNDYYSEAPYCGWPAASSPCGQACCDGRINPDADRADYRAATDMGRDMRALGLAHALTGESRYAEKALEVIRAWCLIPGTRMNPKITNYQSQIELYITLPGMLYGADLIWGHSSWTAADREGFRDWTRTLMEDVRARSHWNNFENWRLVLLAAGAVMIDDAEMLHEAFEAWKGAIARQVGMDGVMKEELERTRSLDYSLYAVNAMAQTAEIARHHGIDLYNYRLEDGRGLEKILDFHAPHLLNPSGWPHAQISAYKGENACVYELAFAVWRKPDYERVIHQYGRPLYDIRVMGPVSLTHAFALPVTGLSGIESGIGSGAATGGRRFEVAPVLDGTRSMPGSAGPAEAGAPEEKGRSLDASGRKLEDGRAPASGMRIREVEP